jgi:hypothetical protein
MVLKRKVKAKKVLRAETSLDIGGRMVLKRKVKAKKVLRAAKKKAKAVKSLKKSHKAPAAKKLLRAKAPARVQKAPAAKAAPQAKAAAAPQAQDRHGKGTAKTQIKSAKQALELLEAKVAEVKGKGKGVRGGRKSRKDEWVAGPAPTPEDAETRRTRLKNLIKLGKERGFLTYSEINDHLPDDLVDAEQIEAIISTFGDMGIQVYDQAPDQETLLIASDAPPVAQPDDDVEEQAEAALSTVDSEFGRTTDPVRMYMREMGSVELLTREGEIEIAKRIEDGLRHMIQAISACPTTVQEILDLADKVEKDELRIDEVVDGRRSERQGRLRSQEGRVARGRGSADRGRRGRRRGSGRRRAIGEPAQAARRGAGEVRPHPPALREDGQGARAQGLQGQGFPARARPDLQRADGHPLHRAHRRAPLRQREEPGRRGPAPRARDPRQRGREGADAAPALHQGVRKHRGL